MRVGWGCPSPGALKWPYLGLDGPNRDSEGTFRGCHALLLVVSTPQNGPNAPVGPRTGPGRRRLLSRTAQAASVLSGRGWCSHRPFVAPEARESAPNLSPCHLVWCCMQTHKQAKQPAARACMLCCGRTSTRTSTSTSTIRRRRGVQISGLLLLCVCMWYPYVCFERSLKLENGIMDPHAQGFRLITSCSASPGPTRKFQLITLDNGTLF